MRFTIVFESKKVFGVPMLLIRCYDKNRTSWIPDYFLQV